MEIPPTMEITPGTAVITARVLARTERTVRHTLAMPTTHPPGLTRAVPRCQRRTGAQPRGKHTTQGRERTAPRINPPTPLGVTEARRSQGTARPLIHSTKLLPRALWERIKARQEPRVQPPQAHMVVLRWARPPVAPSTRSRTGMSTRTPVADGSKRREPRSPARVIREAIPLPQEVGESRGGAAKPRLPSAGMGGNPGRRVLEVLGVVVEEEVGAEAAADADKSA